MSAPMSGLPESGLVDCPKGAIPVIAVVRVTEFMEPAIIRSFRLDVGGPDDLAPFLRFVGDELCKISGGTREWHHAQISKSSYCFVVSAFAQSDGVPMGGLIARHKIAHGWDAGQCVRSRGRCHRQRA